MWFVQQLRSQRKGESELTLVMNILTDWSRLLKKTCSLILTGEKNWQESWGLERIEFMWVIEMWICESFVDQLNIYKSVKIGNTTACFG